MPSVVGTPVQIVWATGSAPAAQSVTVPAGATAAYAFGTVFGGGPGNGLLSATLNGVAAAQVFEVADEAGFVPAAWVAVWYNPTSGSQNLQVAFDGTPVEGPTTAFVCVTDSDTTAWRDADAANDVSTPQTITLTTVSGDLVLCLDSKFSTAPANESGWTSLLTTSNNNHAGRLRSIVASGTTQSATTQDTDTSGIVAVAIPAGAGGAATLSAPTPSGTIGTATSANIGATTNQASGTIYAVVDTAANLSGVTIAQVKAGQRASGAAALSAANNAVSSLSPSANCTGLTASTLYSYAVVQNNTNGDSNLLTGTFTTAAPGGAGDNPLLAAKFPIVVGGGLFLRT